MSGAGIRAGRHRRDVGRFEDEEAGRCRTAAGGSHIHDHRHPRRHDFFHDGARRIDQAAGRSQLDDHGIVVSPIRFGQRASDELVADRMDHVVHGDSQYGGVRAEGKSEGEYDEKTPHGAHSPTS